ncbi:MAG: hypothetical protein A3H98_04600 [Bacteroidetes bacterium RIFCSPLOWO2_02_FULL_36_8]|nr:MAG: hypothetical protein A3H98_04600 [Bacteroidetes bacterium RIFCSPLOWO2_02_FULL_36_8]OFY70662.1 MAG: hypothetical protein A3G23_08005 [Bacteroidetes bacterium RIFCSPLOWO2_12_FULL_37_12]
MFLQKEIMQNIFRAIVVFLIFIVTFGVLKAQDSNYNRINDINLILGKDSVEHISINSWSGYRIQVFSGSNRSEAMSEKSKISKTFPALNCYLVYVQPFFKIRVGDYLTRQEVYNDYATIKNLYPYSLIVNDQINYK